MATSFPIFTDLPIELQRLIWDAAVTQLPPRSVFLQYRKLAQHRSHRVWSSKSLCDPTFFTSHADPKSTSFSAGLNTPEDDRRAQKGFRCLTPLPAFALTCSEAYEAFTRSYSRAFGTAHSFPETWIDFEKDILYMACHMRCVLRGANPCLASISKTDMACSDFQHVRTVAIDYRGLGGRGFPASVVAVVRLFPKVRRLVIPDRQFTRFRDAVAMDGLYGSVDRAIGSYSGWRDCHGDVEALLAEANGFKLEDKQTMLGHDVNNIEKVMRTYCFEHKLPKFTSLPKVEYVTFVERKKMEEFERLRREYPEMRETFRRNCGKGCSCPPTEDEIQRLVNRFQVVLHDIQKLNRAVSPPGAVGAAVEV